MSVYTCKLALSLALDSSLFRNNKQLQHPQDTRDSNGPFASNPNSTNGVLFLGVDVVFPSIGYTSVTLVYTY